MRRFINSLVMMILVSLGSFLTIFTWSAVVGEPVSAAVIKEGADATCSKSILGLRPWYRGLVTRDGTKDNQCRIGTIAEDGNGNTKVAPFVWVIILNLMYDASLLSSLVATGFIVWGGYKYITSEGDPSKVMTGKKIITGAVIGLILTVSASMIADTIVNVLESAAS